MKDRYNLGAGADDGSASKTTSTSNTDKAEATSIPGTISFHLVFASHSKRILCTVPLLFKQPS